HRINGLRLISLNIHEGNVVRGVYSKHGQPLCASRRPSSLATKVSEIVAGHGDATFAVKLHAAVNGLPSVFNAVGQDSWKTTRARQHQGEAEVRETGLLARWNRSSALNSPSVFSFSEWENIVRNLERRLCRDRGHSIARPEGSSTSRCARWSSCF
ncbi:hypothetical protein MTO96_033928, partial [Rhipicephalus appendiculatus]